jgi:hypothetical protein
MTFPSFQMIAIIGLAKGRSRAIVLLKPSIRRTSVEKYVASYSLNQQIEVRSNAPFFYVYLHKFGRTLLG